MDGLWSSDDLPATLKVAALNREALGVTGGWLRAPLQFRERSPIALAATRSPAAVATSVRTTT